MDFENHNNKKEVIKNIELTAEDRKLMDILHDIRLMQKDLINLDIQEREGFVLNKTEVKKCFDDAVESANFFKKAMNGISLTAHDLSDNSSISNEEMLEIQKQKQRILNRLYSRIPEELQYLINDAKQEGVLPIDFLNRLDGVVNEKLHESSKKRMQDIMHINEQISEFSFTTDQKGSGRKYVGNPEYDSIYYMFPLSNGTHILQRIKRSVMHEGLQHAVQPVAVFALFIREGSNIDGMNIQSGTYSQRELVEFDPSSG
jgi:hypothetical protein